MASVFALSRFVCGERFSLHERLHPLRISVRRYPAGVNRRFDDIAGETDELIRLAQRGHVFGAGDAMEPNFTDNINQAPMRGPIDTQ